MYVEAIEKVGKFTRPILSISRNYGSKLVQPGTATLFFVNSDGWALTCGHVADQIVVAGKIDARYRSFKKDLADIAGKKKAKRLRRELEKKYKLNSRETMELKNRFIDCVKGRLNITIKKHPFVDLALIKFEDFDELLCREFPIFPANTSTLMPGKMLCRIGFPFAEFSNFQYNQDNDEIEWIEEGKRTTPRFPIEGMVTRRLLNEKGQVVGFEMSTPGIRGQSGGPVFDANSIVWGVQAMTKHLDLNFDVDQKVIRQGKMKRVQDSAFLHVGGCIHIEVVKQFMKDNGVSFTEG